MQYSHSEPYNPSNMAQPTSNQAYPAQPQPHASPSAPPQNAHLHHPSHPSSLSHSFAPEYPHYSSHHPRGGFFGSWFNQYLPPPPNQPLNSSVAGPPYHSQPPYRPYAPHSHYRVYRRCGGRGGGGRFISILIVGGAGYFAYRKLNEKIEGVRAEVEGGRQIATGEAVEVSRTGLVEGNGGRAMSNHLVDGNGERQPHWGWHGRRSKNREMEAKSVELERKQNEFESKMREWEEAIKREKDSKKEEPRWI